MSEEFNIFKNLEDLKKINLLDQLRNLEAAKPIDFNNSRDDDDDFDFDNLLNNNTKKAPSKKQNKKESSVTPEKKAKKNIKIRKDSKSSNRLPSPTIPSLENVNEKVDDMPPSSRTRRSLRTAEKEINSVMEVQQPVQLENIEPTSSKGKGGRGRGRGKGPGRARGKGRNKNNSQTNSDLLENSINVTGSSGGVSEVDSDYRVDELSIMDRFLQQGQANRGRRTSGRRNCVMRARRRYIAEIAARSTQVDFIDLVSSPFPRVEGMIDLDSDTEETSKTTSNDKKSQEQQTTTKLNLNDSFDEDNPEINIKIIWNSKPETFQLRKYQKFAVIFNKLAERENINMENIVFNLNERLISPDDTPESIDYKVYNFIDGRAMSRFNMPKAATTKKHDANKITLKIQSDKWKRPLQIDLLKTDKFRILYIKCAEELKVNLEQLKLSFDGDILELNDTPLDLELEGGEAIDLRIKD